MFRREWADPAASRRVLRRAGAAPRNVVVRDPAPVFFRLSTRPILPDMPNCSVYFFHRSTCALFFLSLMLVVAGCDEETIGPRTQGTLEGVVQDAETNDPIAQANVTTSPPTQSVLTNEDGTFEIADIPTGNYSIQATKTNYQSRAVQVSVQENQPTSTTLLLERENNFGSETDSLTAEVINWFNDRVNRDSSGADSIFADVEYSAENVGDVRIQDYEVYFKIDTAEGTFAKEVSGDSLDTGQRDVGGFRKYIPAEAQGARVEDVYWSTDSD
jgi:hypothetical protein